MNKVFGTNVFGTKVFGTFLLSCLLMTSSSCFAGASEDSRRKMVVSGLLTAGLGFSSVYCFVKMRKELDAKKRRLLKALGIGCAIGGTLSGLYFCYELFAEVIRDKTLTEGEKKDEQKKKEEKLKKIRDEKLTEFKKELFERYAKESEMPKLFEEMSDGEVLANKVRLEVDNFFDEESLPVQDKIDLQGELIKEWERFYRENAYRGDGYTKRINLDGTCDHFRTLIKNDKKILDEQKKREEEARLEREEQERLEQKKQERLRLEREGRRLAQDEVEKHRVFDNLIIRASRITSRNKRQALFKDIKNINEIMLIRRVVATVRGGGEGVRDKMIGALEFFKGQKGVEERVDRIISGYASN